MTNLGPVECPMHASFPGTGLEESFSRLVISPTLTLVSSLVRQNATNPVMDTLSDILHRRGWEVSVSFPLEEQSA